MEKLMDYLIGMKAWIFAVIGVIGGVLGFLLGGVDITLKSLLFFLIVDYFLGLAVAGFFNNSPKSKTGGLQSYAGWQGLVKKGVTLLIVMVGTVLDLMLKTEFIRTGVILAFASNELLSIVENVGLMGIDMPPVIVKALDMLERKEEGINNDR